MIGGNVSRFFQKGQITPDSRLCPLNLKYLKMQNFNYNYRRYLVEQFLSKNILFEILKIIFEFYF